MAASEPTHASCSKYMGPDPMSRGVVTCAPVEIVVKRTNVSALRLGVLHACFAKKLHKLVFLI